MESFVNSFRMLGGLFVLCSCLFGLRAQEDTVDIGKLKANVHSAQDLDELCCFWAYEGQCDDNPKYMKVNCPRACGTILCQEDNIVDCPTQVIKRCGGNFTLIGSFENNIKESKKYWEIEKNLEAAYNNPHKLNVINVTDGQKSKRSTNRAKRQSLTQIQKDFPDKKVVFVPNRPPYNLTIGALVFTIAGTGVGLDSFCSASIVNIGSKEQPHPVILTAAHCVVNVEPTCCGKTCNCDKSEDTFCDKIDAEHCTPDHKTFQFNLNYRRNKGVGVDVAEISQDDGAMDTTRIHVHKQVCYELCKDKVHKEDSRHDYAIIELADYKKVKTYLELATEVPDWAANMGYSMKDCYAKWPDTELPGVANTTSGPAWCWGNNKHQQPIGIGGPIAHKPYNGANYTVHEHDPSGNGDSGAPWLSKDFEVIGVTSFSDGKGNMWATHLLQEDFQHLREEVVHRVNPRAQTHGEAKPDVEASCCGWAKQGDCDNYPFFMRVNCQESCGTPGCLVQKALLCIPKVKEDC